MNNWKELLFVIAVGVLMLLTTNMSRADQCKYNATLGSIHLGDTSKYPKFNEQNYGVGMECSGVQSGVYYNSLYRPSLYVGGTLPLGDSYGLKYGLVTGYDIPIAPYTAGYVKVYDVEFTIIPFTQYNPMAIAYTYWF